jgi:hypothetical protein
MDSAFWGGRRRMGTSLAQRPKEKNPFGRPRHGWEGKIICFK